MNGDSVIRLFPREIRPYFERAAQQADSLNEIRIRSGRPVLVNRRGNEYMLSESGKEIALPVKRGTSQQRSEAQPNGICFDAAQVEHIFHHICQYSPYAYEEELKNGFLTVSGGHRVGVAGQILSQHGSVQSIRNIRFLNIRISHEIIGCADPVMDRIYDPQTGRWHSTMIIAPPACGKTTLLRDMIRQISDGTAGRQPQTVGLVDERSEIAGCFYGQPQNDVGMRTDVLDGCPKACGMEMLLRSMAPDVIAVDEIATDRDVETLLLSLHCGTAILATVHGSSIEEMAAKKYLKPLFGSGCFQRFVILSGIKQAVVINERGEAI